jgi:hypothetical protein
MNQKSQEIIFRISTGILSIIVLMFVANSIFNREMFTNRFSTLGYPIYIIYPLVVAKLLGLIAIWSNRSAILKEWAYAGFFFNFVLAFLAEIHAIDGEYISSPLALIFLLISYISGKKVFEKQPRASNS